MKALFATVVILIGSFAYGQTVNQTSTGFCSPNVNGNNIIVWIDCRGVDPASMKRIDNLLTTFAGQFPEILNALNEVVSKQQKEIDKARQNIHLNETNIQAKQDRINFLEQSLIEWIRRYKDIDLQFKATNGNDELRKQALDVFHHGDLDKAEVLLVY